MQNNQNSRGFPAGQGQPPPFTASSNPFTSGASQSRAQVQSNVSSQQPQFTSNQTSNTLESQPRALSQADGQPSVTQPSSPTHGSNETIEVLFPKTQSILSLLHGQVAELETQRALAESANGNISTYNQRSLISATLTPEQIE